MKILKAYINFAFLTGGCLALTSESEAGTINFYSDRSTWDAAVGIGYYWDVNFSGDGNNLTPGSPYAAGSPISVPWPEQPGSLTLSCNQTMSVVSGNGFYNYIPGEGPTDQGYAPPAVLAASGQNLAGTFLSMYNNYGFDVGFEVLGTLGSTITVNVDGDSQNYLLSSGVQFIGWTEQGFGTDNFSVSSETSSPYEIGNFVVPDSGGTLGLLGVGLIGLGSANRFLRQSKAA